jgi:hypothetical protein
MKVKFYFTLEMKLMSKEGRRWRCGVENAQGFYRS